MNTVMTNPESRLKVFRITDDEIIASLVDGRTISVPLVWSWRLSEATPEQRNHFEILGDEKASTGRISTRISAWRGCCPECLLHLPR
uniref:DUF2442 domain-containing protein n=1 Tax=Candidatus Kentrum sp. FW TaxID=2126338 RepID=A0A450TWH4_9GAMM|nr:MAG: Protein of unknown function (DUF2442) [Candidatus Kentron sp. FW]